MPRIVVDEDLCQAHAMCALEAPEVFDVPRDPPVRVVGAVTDANADAVRLAVRYCPTGAIKLEDD